MSQKLINHSPDLSRLRDEGYEIAIKNGVVYIQNVPYLTSNLEVKYGILADLLNFAGDVTYQPKDHTMYFCGEHPCNIHGQELPIKASDCDNALCEGITARHHLSCKKHYPDYYEKFTEYIRIISSHAKEKDPSATAQTFIKIDSDEDAVFNYEDTNTTRAKIYPVSRKLNGQKIAIVGVGGTGSYILDLIAKTPVAEIHLYDDDVLLTHNAFRQPGATSLEQLRKKPLKADYHADVYRRIRKNNIFVHGVKVNEENLHELLAFDFVFISIDNGTARRLIHQFLVDHNRAFIDVGIDVRLVDDSLFAVTRTTLGKPNHYDHLKDRVSYADTENDEYNSNIQISELNALNASFAVIKWKQMCGFYLDYYDAINITYNFYDGGLTHAYKEQ